MRQFSVLFFIFLALFPLQAQRDTDALITGALSKGDAVALSAYFNEHVELVLTGINDVYSKKQATGILVDFFRKNKVQTYQLLHKGTKENSAFTIGTITTATGDYRVYILLRRSAADRQLIQQLRIESSND